jgi:hypothetical protein
MEALDVRTRSRLRIRARAIPGTLAPDTSKPAANHRFSIDGLRLGRLARKR